MMFVNVSAFVIRIYFDIMTIMLIVIVTVVSVYSSIHCDCFYMLVVQNCALHYPYPELRSAPLLALTIFLIHTSNAFGLS